MKKPGQYLLIVAFCLSSAQAQDKGIGSVFLKLLEPIAPQSSGGNQDKGEIVTSDLGDLLKDPKNESLKAIKVIGTQKRLKGESKEVHHDYVEGSGLRNPSGDEYNGRSSLFKGAG